MRADSYKNVTERLNAISEETNMPIGRKIILPSSITGTPRWEMEQFQDAMVMMMVLGRPDLFITMTCNPLWKEIQDELYPGQRASDRCEIVTRVFNIKKNIMIDLLMNGQIFGKAIAFLCVIEFQLRGLPHAHILVTLDNNDKMLTPEDIDEFIWAQLPDKEKYPRLYEKVTKYMTHGPHQTNADGTPIGPCMRRNKDGQWKCRFDYPKAFREETTISTRGYPEYARPDNGRNIEENGLDNRWIVPYNPYLLLYMDCHVNVERVFDIQSIKYMYKYIYKGPDRAAIQCGVPDESGTIIYDETNKFLDTRIVSAPEGCWHIFRYKMQEKSHAIIRLPLHLKGDETVMWNEDLSEEEIMEQLEPKKMLIGKNLQNFSTHYVF